MWPPTSQRIAGLDSWGLSLRLSSGFRVGCSNKLACKSIVGLLARAFVMPELLRYLQQVLFIMFGTTTTLTALRTVANVSAIAGIIITGSSSSSSPARVSGSDGPRRSVPLCLHPSCHPSAQWWSGSLSKTLNPKTGFLGLRSHHSGIPGFRPGAHTRTIQARHSWV